jgi:hypothetical protein
MLAHLSIDILSLGNEIGHNGGVAELRGQVQTSATLSVPAHVHNKSSMHKHIRLNQTARPGEDRRNPLRPCACSQQIINA